MQPQHGAVLHRVFFFLVDAPHDVRRITISIPFCDWRFSVQHDHEYGFQDMA